MRDIDLIVERQFARNDLIQRVDEAFWKEVENVEKFSGQDSERFLVQAVRKFAGRPMSLGDLGTHVIVNAHSMAGGLPEPKADVVLVAKDGQKFGISMKKENFEFLENWMDRKKLMERLQQVGMTIEEASVVVARLIEQARLSTSQLADVIRNERATFVAKVKEKVPGYEYPQSISKDVMNSLAEYEEFRTEAGAFSIGKFRVTNYYIKLSGLFEERYGDFLRLIVAGGEENKRKADAVLVADVPGDVATFEQLQEVLDNIKSVETVVKHYKSNPKINIAFRLRPITLTRTTYSRTNANKYRVGKRFFEDPELGISWTVSVVSVGSKADKDEVEES